MKKGVCTNCEKKRSYMYIIGREDIGLLSCLYCVKAIHNKISCNICLMEICYSDEGYVLETYCTDCRKEPNVECEKCKDDICYMPEKGEYNKMFCTTCVDSLRKIKH